MNKSTQKILIIAISAIVVIVAATVALLVVPGMLDKEKDDKETTTFPTPEATVEEYEGEAHTYFPVVNTPEEPSEMTTLGSLLASTQNALAPSNRPTSATPPTKKPAANKPVATTKPAANKPAATTKPASNGGTHGDTESGLNVKDVIGDEGIQVLGYRWSDDGYYYTDDKDCWQSGAGYNEIYDNMAPLTAMFIDQVRVRFNYGNKDWMIQLWKGQYGWLLVGAEIGLYTAKEGANSGEVSDINHYNCASKEDWLYMSLDCYWAEGNNGHYKKIFSRPYAKYWWPTGFVKGQLTKYTWPRTELKVKGRITFKDAVMADAFVAELRKTGFARAAGSSSSQLADDTYFQNGADVVFLWSTIYHDCFK